MEQEPLVPDTVRASIMKAESIAAASMEMAT